MKRFIKILTSALAIVLFATCALSFTACEDIRKMEFNMSVYNVTDKKTEEDTLTIDLYRHLAPKTVDAVMAAAKTGAYDNTFFYKIGTINGGSSIGGEYSNQIMIGDLKWENGKIVQNQAVVTAPTVKGEFERGGVIGSNLKYENGTIGLWRTWFANGTYNTNNGLNTGRATLFLPMAGQTAFDGNFAIFGKYDVNADIMSTVRTLINGTIDANNFEEYWIYYTGEYTETGVNNGLTFHCITVEEMNEMSDAEKDEIFIAEGDQLACYGAYVISVPVLNKNNAATKTVAAKVTSVTVR